MTTTQSFKFKTNDHNLNHSGLKQIITT